MHSRGPTVLSFSKGIFIYCPQGTSTVLYPPQILPWPEYRLYMIVFLTAKRVMNWEKDILQERRSPGATRVEKQSVKAIESGLESDRDLWTLLGVTIAWMELDSFRIFPFKSTLIAHLMHLMILPITMEKLTNVLGKVELRFCLYFSPRLPCHLTYFSERLFWRL